MQQFYKTYGFISKSFLLGIYVAFFSVQLFFNFDAGSQDQIIYSHFHQNSYGHANPHVVRMISYCHSSSQQDDNIRLNKRYQPEIVPDGCIILCRLYVEYAEKPFLAFDHNESLLTSIRLSKPLRGPPLS